MSKQDDLLLTDEEIREVADNLSSDGHYFIWELAHAVAEAQLAKAVPVIEKRERERIIKVLTKRGLFDDFLCSEKKALKNNCPTCKMFWQALKGER